MHILNQVYVNLIHNTIRTYSCRVLFSFLQQNFTIKCRRWSCHLPNGNKKRPSCKRRGRPLARNRNPICPAV